MKKPLLSALMITTLFGLSALASAVTLRIHQDADIRSTDPGVNRDGNTDFVVLHMVEGLVGYDAQGQPKPLLAERVDVSADGLTYTFALRRDVKFHNGKTLTSDDVLWSWRRYTDPKTGWRCLADFDGRTRLKVESVHAPGRIAIQRRKRPAHDFHPLGGSEREMRHLPLPVGHGRGHAIGIQAQPAHAEGRTRAKAANRQLRILGQILPFAREQPRHLGEHFRDAGIGAVQPVTKRCHTDRSGDIKCLHALQARGLHLDLVERHRGCNLGQRRSGHSAQHRHDTRTQPHPCPAFTHHQDASECSSPFKILTLPGRR